MEAKQCPKGHFYDSEKYASCPRCQEENVGKTMPLGGTMPLESNGFDPIPATEPIIEPYDVPVPDAIAHNKNDDAGYPDNDESKTRPYDESNLGFAPTVGWVVCIKGPHKGQDFHLCTGYNKVGRSREMAVCLPMDEQITRESHAIIAYEPSQKKFFAAGDKNMIYINGTFVMGMHELHTNDIIKIGASELMFIPLCGDVFNWE